MPVKIQTIKDIRELIKAELSILDPDTEIRSLTNIILRNILGTGMLQMGSQPEMAVPDEKAERIRKITAELRTGRPLQYILGEPVFYDCTIRVNEHTLIPRQETEELVDLIIKENKGYHGEIIDMGTGSGCIAIALVKNLKGTHVTAIEISQGALDTAILNAAYNAVTVNFIKADILVPDRLPCKPAGIIVSNPPYVRESEKNIMHRNVLEHEPHGALFVPDNDPLVFYRAILDSARILLVPSGRIYFEINEVMGAEVASLAESYSLKNIAILKDLNGKERFVKAERNG
jgi:release factor glutamine methyltransferase